MEILRHELYCHDHGLGDIIVEDYIESPLVIYDSGFGIFAVGDLNEEVARADLRRILDQTEGCSIEIVMKDISTVDYTPQKLWRWAEIAREEIDRKYN